MRFNFLPSTDRLRSTTLARPATLAPRMPVRRDPDPAQDNAIREIDGNVVYTSRDATAWFVLPETVWAFRSDTQRENLLGAVAEQYAALGGRRIHLRRTTRPYDAQRWRDQYNAAARPLRDIPGGPTWASHLHRAVRHLDSGWYADGLTMLGVTLGQRQVADAAVERIRRLAGRGVTAAERGQVAEQAAQLAAELGAPGLEAQPASEAEVAWLVYRSAGLGLTPDPQVSLDPAEILSLTEHVDAYRSRYGSTVRLVDRLTGEDVHTAVLTVGRMDELEVPQQHEPWLHVADRAGWPVELSVRATILTPDQTASVIHRRLRMIRSQQQDYRDHRLDPPEHLERLAQHALEVGDEIDTGTPVDAARVHGWFRLAVSAPTDDECRARIVDLKRLYRDDANTVLQHPRRQWELYQEFTPGQPIVDGGYVRRMPVRVLAGAVPQAASVVGDGRGDLLGHTAGTSRRPVAFDPHYPTEVRERSGLAVCIAEPGGGKSTLMGAIGYLAARRGVQVTLLDPSGPLARLAEMPELKPHARTLDLVAAAPGTLNPYALVPTRSPIVSDDRLGVPALPPDHAEFERRALATDICAMLLPAQHASRSDVATVLRNAVLAVPAEADTTLDDIVDELENGDHGQVGVEVASLLRYAAGAPYGNLFFGDSPAGVLADDTALTVITMAGLQLPDPSVPRETWSHDEAMAVPMLHCAHRLAVRRCYSGDMHRRKLVGLDEAHVLGGWSSGRSFFVRLSRDSRKWNLAALLASQDPRDIAKLDMQNLVSTVFVGRIVDDPELAEQALRLLRVPAGSGYEQTLAGLSAQRADATERLGHREFLMRDVDGRTQKIRADFTWVPGLLQYLDTTPTAPTGGAR